jgi:hypothetical protein
MDIDEFEDYLEQQDTAVQKTIATSNTKYREGKARPATELLSELSRAEPKNEHKKGQEKPKRTRRV